MADEFKPRRNFLLKSLSATLLANLPNTGFAQILAVTFYRHRITSTISYIGVSKDQSYLGTKPTLVLPLPAGTANGDFLVLCVSETANYFTIPAGFTVLINNTAITSMRVAYRIWSTGDPSSYTLTCGTGDAGTGALFTFRKSTGSIAISLADNPGVAATGTSLAFSSVAGAAKYALRFIAFETIETPTWSGFTASVSQNCQGETSRSLTIGHGGLTGGTVPAHGVTFSGSASNPHPVLITLT